jgi:transposase
MDFLPIHKDQETLVILGIDTHADVHVAVALDGHGRRLGHKSVPSTEAGYAALVAWVEEFGTLERAGIEGSGSFGVGLARFLRARGVEVVEVNRPNRQHRRRFGKHDTADAEAAARALQANTATGEPKSSDGPAEMVRTLHVVRRSALKARTQAANQLRALLVTAPEELRAQLRGLSTAKLVAAAARFRPGDPKDLRGATKLAMRSLARRHRRLSEEIAELDEQIARLVSEAVPALAALRGVGTDTAASLLVAVGDNPERLKSEASFAHLCGVAPVPASSGKTVRHRLNRGGNRDANRALHVLALGRMSWDERTREYVARRTAEDKNKREILRCLKL